MKKAAIFLAEGFEEVEALMVVDILRRAGVITDTVSIKDVQVTGSHGISVNADECLDVIDFTQLDILILPGGMPGTRNLESCEELRKGIEYCYHSNKYLAAICAAPTILGKMGYLEGRMACVYPGYEEELVGAQVVETATIKDGNIITGRSMGCAMPFALQIVETLLGSEKASEVKKSLVY